MTWGAAQLGVGQGVLDAVADGLLPPESVDELILLAAVWVDPDANDETAVRHCEPRGDAERDRRRRRRHAHGRARTHAVDARDREERVLLR